MRTDYKKQFTRDFKIKSKDDRQFEIDFDRKKESNIEVNKDLLRYKCRLYDKLSGKNINDIFAGYDLWVDEGNKFYPSIPDLLSSISRVSNERLKLEKQKKEIEQNNSQVKLQKTSGMAVKMLIQAKEKVDAGNPTRDKKKWLERKKLAELELNKNTCGIQKKYADNVHECTYHGCRKPGSITNSTRGGENWYCTEHIILG